MEPRFFFGRLQDGFHRESGSRSPVWSVCLALLIAVATCWGGPETDWNEVIRRAPWAARDGHTSVVHQGKLWILGGGETGGKTNRNDIWFSSDGVDWSQAVATAPWRARSHHASVAFKDRIWVLGGLAYDELKQRNVYLNDIWSSSNGVSWSTARAVAPWPGRCHHTAVVCHDRIWLIGGENSGGDKKLSDVWCSSDGEHWVEVTASAPWGGRSYHASTVHSNRIWVFGGICPESKEGMAGRFRNDVWSSSDGVNWTLMTVGAGWTPRMAATAVSWGGQMWLLGGSVSSASSGPQNDVWSSSDGLTWTEVFPAARWPRRAEHSSVIFADSIWLLGGSIFRARVSYNDVWRLRAGQ
jgi:N-acetylneuraminic acid mutarotase